MTTALLASAFSVAGRAEAAPVYFALGDSITFGETNLQYVPSYGDRPYASDFADILANQTGTRPNIINLAIDGETTASFMDINSPRTPPVQGRTNVPLQTENLNYNPSNLVPQGALFAADAAAQKAMGNTISTVSLTLGFNGLAALSPMQNTPAAEAAAIAMIPAELATYKIGYAKVLDEIRIQAPNATLYLNGYYNPFPADPTSPAAPIFAAGGTALNSIIQGFAAQYGAIYVDNATPFLGHEAQYTYEGVLPAGSSVLGPYGGILPIGDVHPNDLGYQVIANDMAAAGFGGTAVPEPSTWALMAAGLGALGFALRRRRRAAPAQA